MEFKPLENERWVWAKTFERYYPNLLVSDMGRCYNSKTKRFVGRWSHYGHWTVGLYDKDKPETMMIGRLMLISFDVPIPEHLQGIPTNKLQAMHLDGDSTNNNISNFAWGDNRENQNEENCRRRKSELKKKPILQYTKDGEFVKEWNSMCEAARELSINQSSISQCANGKKKSAGGYIWKYKKEVA